MRQVLSVDVKDYKIIITDDKFAKLMEELESYTCEQNKLFVVSQKVYRIYKKELELNKYNCIVIKDGENQKNFKNYIKILEKAKEVGLTRSDVIIALGGGVVGDIAGFAASTYMRGIDYIQVPTTLLSMVDSSVGGKTAIDLGDAKNIVGAFYQPKRVYININFLKTLDERQYKSGIGEVLKYAFIEDNCGYKHPLFLFEFLTLSAERLLSRELKTLLRVIENCLLLKISVVNQDEKESGLRKILNLGHTYGHALESLGGYRKYLHGEAVVQGMFFIFNYAYSKGIINYSNYRLAVDLMSKYGFKSFELNYSYQKIFELMKKDKKAEKDLITFIVPFDKKKVKEIKLSEEETLEMF